MTALSAHVQVFYPLGITKLSVGADYNPMEASWRVHTSWRDQIIGQCPFCSIIFALPCAWCSDRPAEHCHRAHLAEFVHLLLFSLCTFLRLLVPRGPRF